jgi:hypothetical protein
MGNIDSVSKIKLEEVMSEGLTQIKEQSLKIEIEDFPYM